MVFADTTLRPIDRVAFVPETLNQDDAFGAINGVIAHENGHNFFGFGDIYDISTALPTVGYWSLMDSGNLLGARLLTSQGEIYAVGLLPPSIDPFQRDFATISESGILSFRRPGAADTAAFALHGSQRTNDFVKLDLSSDEYLILENRYLAPAAAVRLKQDDSTRVVLGPLLPDSLEYDALLPGGGVLVWHVDESVLPFNTSLRVNPDFGFNTNHRRYGLQLIEADGLDDLGDVGSPFLLGSVLDPYQASVAPTLSDVTVPDLRPNQGTRPHLRIDFMDDASDTMHVRVTRTWQPAGWPVRGNFPPGGPRLLTMDLDGDGKRDVLWAGGKLPRTGQPAGCQVRVTRTCMVS
ncbi:MAG: immune inhibitor A domain-containing protein, partial [bacterium]